MSRSWLITLSLIISTMMMSACDAGEPNTASIGINNSVEIPIEYVSIQTTVSVSGSNASEVEEEGYEKMLEVIHTLRDAGFPDDAIRSDAGNMRTSRQQMEERHTYQAQVRFDLHEPDLIDTVRDELIAAGATQFQILGYGNTNEEEIFEEAYRNSITEARERLQRQLGDEDVVIGPVLNIEENVSVVVSAAQRDNRAQMDMGASLTFENTRESLMTRTVYNKPIRFNIDFELLRP